MRYFVFAVVLLIGSAALGDEYQILHFEATWCSPCRQLKVNMADEKFKAVVKKYKIKVKDIDIDVDPKSMEAYKVTVVPTCVLVIVNDKKEAQVLKREEGLLTVEKLVKFAEPPAENAPK
jgi:thiol-disulfide isomerase/thioredoxin